MRRPFAVRYPRLFSTCCHKKVFVAVASSLLLSGVASAQIAPSAVKQIQEIYKFKSTLTPTEKKMSTSLVLASRLAHHKDLGDLARLATPLRHDSNGRLEIEVSGYMTPSLMNSEAMKHAEKVNDLVPAAAFASGRVRTRVTDAQLQDLANSSDVLKIRPAALAHTNAGSITSQGYVAERANAVVAGGVTGKGVKVGVLSDSASASRVAALIASGDLPANTVVLPGQAGQGEDEGAAMMEIVHDMAPGAQLFFATAFNGETSFAENIRTLRFTYGCDVIVDDVSYFDEPVFQDGGVAQAVNDVTKDGALYFSSAANSGNLTSGTSGTWEGDFSSGGNSTLITLAEGQTVQVNNFGTKAKPQTYDTLTSAPGSGVVLQWADAWGTADDDYDLFVLNSTGTQVKGFSADPQEGDGYPFEWVYPGSDCGTATQTGYCPAAGDRVVVALYNGDRRALHIDTERATLAIGTSGATFGHNAGASTVSMAAVYWNAAKRGPVPFTGGASNPDESFSSDGPRKIFYNPDGTAITPGNFLFNTKGGKTLVKPDVAAADGVYTATPGFLPFFGTSAAAPHAAGIAALVKSAVPSLTNTQIRQILTSTAMDNMETGIDRDSGYGIINAASAVAAAKAMTATATK